MKEEYRQNFHIDINAPWHNYNETHSFIEGILESLSELPIYLGSLRYDYLSGKFLQIDFDLENEWEITINHFGNEDSFQCSVDKGDDNIIYFEYKSFSLLVSRIKMEI